MKDFLKVFIESFKLGYKEAFKATSGYESMKEAIQDWKEIIKLNKACKRIKY